MISQIKCKSYEATDYDPHNLKLMFKTDTKLGSLEKGTILHNRKVKVDEMKAAAISVFTN